MAEVRPCCAFSLVRARKVTLGTAVVNNAPLPKPIAPLAPSTTTCSMRRLPSMSFNSLLFRTLIELRPSAGGIRNVLSTTKGTTCVDDLQDCGQTLTLSRHLQTESTVYAPTPPHPHDGRAPGPCGKHRTSSHYTQNRQQRTSNPNQFVQ